MKTYIGDFGRSGCSVMVQAKDDGGRIRSYQLPPRYDLRNHSPDGFRWGYGGSGPAQLALALCADATGDDNIASAIYQDFKEAVIAKLDGDKPFEISQLTIVDFAARRPNRETRQ